MGVTILQFVKSCAAAKPPRTRPILVLCGTLVGLLLAEGVLRIAAPQNVNSPFVDNIYGINTQRPNMQSRFAVPHAYDTIASINSQRFRGTKELQTLPSPGVNRVALLGDSLTFGLGANDDETYPAQLERILEDSVGPERVEIVNAGIMGAGTGEEALWFDIWVKRFHPHVVVLNVFWNDVDDDFTRSPFRIDKSGRVSPRSLEELTSASRLHQKIRQLVYALPGFAFLAEHSHLVNLVRRTMSMAWSGARKGSPSDKVTPAQSENTHQLYRDKGLPLLAGELVWLQERAHESGVRLLVVYLPGRAAIYPSLGLNAEETRWKSAAIIETLKEVCLSRGVPFSDLTLQVRTEAQRFPELLYYNAVGDDIHPTAKGYRVIAETVSGFLMQEGVVEKK